MEIEGIRTAANPCQLAAVDCEMATANRTWGEERIAAELLVKVGIHVSPRTVRRYMPRRSPPRVWTGSQTWSTFVRNHAKSVLACDFFIAVTATFRIVYVFDDGPDGPQNAGSGTAASTDPQMLDPPLQPRTAPRELGSGDSRSTDGLVRCSAERPSHSSGPSRGADADLGRTPPRVSARTGRVRGREGSGWLSAASLSGTHQPFNAF